MSRPQGWGVWLDSVTKQAFPFVQYKPSMLPLTIKLYLRDQTPRRAKRKEREKNMRTGSDYIPKQVTFAKELTTIFEFEKQKIVPDYLRHDFLYKQQ
jgi:hypothetical protein